jgi:MFS family permease
MTASTTATLSPVEREQVYRRNFFFFLSDGILFSVALGMIGSTTVIPDFLRQLTDNEILIGLSGNLFEVGYTLPQLFIARYIVGATNKKWWFIGPNIPVRFIILAFAVITMLVGPGNPALILLLFFLCYGLTAFGDGLVGVPWADLAGTSMSAHWRARMFGIMSATTGIIMLLLTPFIRVILSDAGPAFPNNYALLFGISGILFVVSNIPTFFIKELPGGKPVEKLPALSEFLPDLGRVLRTDASFRAIIITRTLTTLFAMASPFYIGYATQRLGLASDEAVPTLLAMQSIGSISGALIYTWLGARSNVLYIRLALTGAALIPILALIAGQVGPLPLYAGFLLSGLTLSNLFISYQNYVITYATADRRPIYAGLFNTIAAVSSLIAPFIAGTIVTGFGYEVLFVVALIMAILALYVTIRHVQNPHREGAAD